MGGLTKSQLLYNVDAMREDDIAGEITEESESESGEEEVMLSEPSKNPLYNKEGLLDKLEDISWPENLDWSHKLSIGYNQEQEVDVNDDLTRELAFYTQALEGTRQSFEKLQSMGLPFLRPPDYYAEMVKTDSHMQKLRSRLLVEKKRIEEAEERRKARESKRIAKEVQAQKLKERAKQKKNEIESVKKWRKQRQQSGFAGGDNGDDEMGMDFEDGKAFERSKKRPGVAPGDRSGGRGRLGGRGGKGKGMERKRNDREYKDSKFGYGGRKGLNKQNTAETTEDFRGFNKGDFPGKKRGFNEGDFPGNKRGFNKGDFPGNKRGFNKGDFPGNKRGFNKGDFSGNKRGFNNGDFAGNKRGFKKGDFPGNKRRKQ